MTPSTIEIRLDLAFNEADICLPDAEAVAQIRTMLGNGFGVVATNTAGVAEPFGRFLGSLEVHTVPGSKVCATGVAEPFGRVTGQVVWIGVST